LWLGLLLLYLLDSASMANAEQSSVALPPAMVAEQSKTVDELAAEFGKIPLFMTRLPQPDAEESNIALEGLQALAYEGGRLEVASNFREQGNECARSKKWKDAKEFYTKAIGALDNHEEEPAEMETRVEEVDEEEEARKEKVLREACFVNRALCHLELS
jgi:hypothetical protein